MSAVRIDSSLPCSSCRFTPSISCSQWPEIKGVIQNGEPSSTANHPRTIIISGPSSDWSSVNEILSDGVETFRLQNRGKAAIVQTQNNALRLAAAPVSRQ